MDKNDIDAKKLFILEKKLNILSNFLLSAIMLILVVNSFKIIKHLKNIDFNIYNKIENKK